MNARSEFVRISALGDGMTANGTVGVLAFVAVA
jgi:hypothetical protein